MVKSDHVLGGSSSFLPVSTAHWESSEDHTVPDIKDFLPYWYGKASACERQDSPEAWSPAGSFQPDSCFLHCL